MDAELESGIQSLASNGTKILATCAGVILSAEKVSSPAQSSWSLLPIAVERNAYGRQNESFIDSVELTEIGAKYLDKDSLKGVFIRAPQITAVEPEVEVLATHNGLPVLVKKDNIWERPFIRNFRRWTRLLFIGRF